eukprot:403359294
MPVTSDTITFYVQAPVALHAPLAKANNKLLSTATFIKQDESKNPSIQLFELKITLSCPGSDSPQELIGLPMISMTMNFEGCPNYQLNWMKSCGHDEMLPMNGLEIKEINSLMSKPLIFSQGSLQHNSFVIPNNMDKIYLRIDNKEAKPLVLQAPYILNFYQAQTIMYPVVKGDAGFGGEIKSGSSKHLLIEFNCLGVKGTEDVILMIESADTNYKEIAIPFRKQCSNKSIFGVIKDDLKQQNTLVDILIILIAFLMLSSCIFGLLSQLQQSSLAGGGYNYRSTQNTIYVQGGSLFGSIKGIVMGGMGSISQHLNQKLSLNENNQHIALKSTGKNSKKKGSSNGNLQEFQADTESNLAISEARQRQYDNSFNNAFGDDVEIDLNGGSADNSKEKLKSKSSSNSDDGTNTQNSNGDTENNINTSQDEGKYGGI